MQSIDDTAPSVYVPWNKGKLTGQKPPLQPKHVWAIRTRLQLAEAKRDLALFNLAIDSKLRGSDLVRLRVEDVAPHGYAIERAAVRQKKTSRPVRFELSEQTRQAIDDCLAASPRRPGVYLFAGRTNGRCLTTRQYARLVSAWIGSTGLDFSLFGTHSLQRTKAHTDLSSHGQSPGRPAAARAYQDRKHGQVPRHRSGRRLGNFRAS